VAGATRFRVSCIAGASFYCCYTAPACFRAVDVDVAAGLAIVAGRSRGFASGLVHWFAIPGYDRCPSWRRFCGRSACIMSTRTIFCGEISSIHGDVSMLVIAVLLAALLNRSRAPATVLAVYLWTFSLISWPTNQVTSGPHMPQPRTGSAAAALWPYPRRPAHRTSCGAIRDELLHCDRVAESALSAIHFLPGSNPDHANHRLHRVKTTSFPVHCSHSRLHQ